jgi:hypothetical protein
MLVLGTSVVRAEGITRVEQRDGSFKVYRHVYISLDGQALRLRSADRKAVLEVVSDACSFTGQLMRCLPYKTTLRQFGESHDIAVEHGTVYLNLTQSEHRLPHSADKLGPLQVLVLLHTMRGTYVSVQGSLDRYRL